MLELLVYANISLPTAVVWAYLPKVLSRMLVGSTMTLAPQKLSASFTPPVPTMACIVNFEWRALYHRNIAVSALDGEVR